MTDFRTLLKVREESPSGGYRLFYPIQVGEYQLSIQASYGHYCVPRKTIDIYEYEAMEVAIFDKNDNWINSLEDEVLENFVNLDDLNESNDGSSCIVYGFISTEIIQNLYEYFIELEYKKSIKY